MIKFRCGSCNQKLGVPDEYAGRRVKCTKCGEVTIVPEVVEFAIQPEMPIEDAGGDRGFNEDLLISVEDGPAVEVAKPEPSLELEEAGGQAIGDSRGAAAIASMSRRKQEAVSERKFPWPIDVLLYPASGQGLGNIALIIIVQFLSVLFCCVGWIFNILIYAYMYWYFCECIRDSAVGGLRAPSALGGDRELLGEFWECLRLIVCYLFFFGPATIYRAYYMFSEAEMSNEIYWILYGYGVFFFPMGILAVVMFGSISGVNPILIVRSIISTFVQYCGFVVLFYGLGFLFNAGVGAMAAATAAGAASGSIAGGIMKFIILIIATRVGFIWMLFVTGHLLGWFYWKYKEKLYWEV